SPAGSPPALPFMAMARSTRKLLRRSVPKRNGAVAKPLGTSLSAARATRELEELNRIGIALSETRDVDRLLSLILQKTRDITAADAGSLYLVERVEALQDLGANNGQPAASKPLQLRFKLTQNDSVQFPFTEQTLPITENSMAGHCALHGQVIE